MAATLIFAGGELYLNRALPAASLVIAADSGLEHAYALGVAVDVLVGDLDSISASALARAEREGVRIERHPVDKDNTDLDLALAFALEHQAVCPTIVVGIGGGRVDHALANVLVLAADRYAPLCIDAWFAGDTLSVVRGSRRFTWTIGDTVTLLPAAGPASGVTTRGLAYPLTDDDLPAGSSRGVSNVVVSAECEVCVREGALFAVHVPGRSAAD